MSEVEKISFLDNQITAKRLEMIKTIAGINRLLSLGTRATSCQEYKELKVLYQSQKEEIYCLSVLIKGFRCGL